MTEMTARPGSSNDEALTATVLAVPGVDAVFAPGRVAAFSVVVTALGGQDPHRRNTVSTTEHGGDTVITARIATQHASLTPETAREVADALLARAAHDASSKINIRVARVA
ncbi:hypothetical protein [Agromyces laixinhei]|uniref:hypothetical protein n=1 Tax=Agromyces laixinhei TaxID=2585717 RepID=UPI0012EDBCD6|nr:hypothetical protein [Agromyces laixinhei]